MTTTSVAPPLPAGWLWEFEEETKRWRFIHIDTEHKQTHFPNAGDELPAPNAKDVPASTLDTEKEACHGSNSGYQLPASNAKDAPPDPPAYSTLEPITTLSATSVIAVQETNTSSCVSHLTTSVASITVEPALGPNRKAVRNLRRKPIGNRSDSNPISPMSPAGRDSIGAYPSARAFCAELPTGGVTQAHRPSLSSLDQTTLKTPSLEEKPISSPQERGVESPLHTRRESTQYPSVSAAVDGRQTFAPPQPAQNAPAVGNMRHSSVPSALPGTPSFAPLQPLQAAQAVGNTHRQSVSVAPNGTQSFAPLEPVQTAPAQLNTPHPDRPNLSTIQSAPDIMQVDMSHTTAISGVGSKRSKLSKMSKGVGDWAKKHPKLVIGSAVMVEIAGLAAGVDLAKDAQAVQRMKQTVKRGMGARPTNSLPVGNTPASKPAQQAAQQATQQQYQQQNQQQTQQQIQQAAHQQAQQLLQQLLQQQAAAGQPLQFQPGAAGNFQQTHLPGPPNNIPNQYQNVQTGASAQQQRPPAQMQQSPVNPGGNFGNSAFPSGQASPGAAQQTPLPQQQGQSGLNGLVNHLNDAYQNHQANQAAQQQAAQQQAAYQQQLDAAAQPQRNSGMSDLANNLASMYQNSQAQQQQQQQQQAAYPQQTSSGLGDLANNLASAYQNNQATQQQAAYQDQLSQQQIAYIQQQSLAQQQATQAQLSQFNQQAAMFQKPYGFQQQPVYIDNSSGDGRGSLADALALATLMDPSSTSDPTTGTTTSDPGSVADPSFTADPSASYSVDPVAEQTMVEEQAFEADSMAWSSIGEDASLEVI